MVVVRILDELAPREEAVELESSADGKPAKANIIFERNNEGERPVEVLVEQLPA